MAAERSRVRIGKHEPVRQANLFVEQANVRNAVASHDHDFLEIVVVTGGRGNHRTLYGQRRIGRGDLLVIGPRQWHAYEKCRRLSMWNCGLGERLLKTELGWTTDDAVLRKMLWTAWLPEARGIVEGRLEPRMLARIQTPLRRMMKATNQAERLGWLLVFLGMVSPTLGGDDVRKDDVRSVHPAVRRVIEAMRRDVGAEWSLDRMAEIGRVNRSYLVRLCRRYTGQSPVAMLLKMRCEQAAILLIETDQPVGEVGMTVGWPDANYFGRRFRCHFGKSPSAFRACHR